MRYGVLAGLLCLVSSVAQAAIQSKEPSLFKQHFQHCQKKNIIGGCSDCVKLFRQNLQVRYRIYLSRNSESRSFEDVCKQIGVVEKDSFLRHALCCQAARVRPHVDYVDEQCPIMLLQQVTGCEKAHKDELKLAAGASDLCALYALGLVYAYGKPEKPSRAILALHAVGEACPKSFADIAQIYGRQLEKWHVCQSEYAQNASIARKSRLYFEHAGDQGYIPGYVQAAKIQRAALQDAIVHMGITNRYKLPREIFANYAQYILQMYEKAGARGTAAAWGKYAQFVQEYRGFFSEQQLSHMLERAAWKNSAHAEFIYAQYLERQERMRDALQHYELAAHGFQKENASDEARDAWCAVARIYEANDQLGKASYILKEQCIVDYADFRLRHVKDLMRKPLYEQAFALHQDLLKTFPDMARDPLLKLFCAEHVECCQDRAKEAQVCRWYARSWNWQAPARQLIGLYRTNPDLIENVEARRLLVCFNFQARDKHPFYVQGLLAEDAAAVSDVTSNAYRDDAVRMYVESLRKAEAPDAATGLIRLIGYANTKACVGQLNFDSWDGFSDEFRTRFAKEFRARIYAKMRRYRRNNPS